MSELSMTTVPAKPMEMHAAAGAREKVPGVFAGKAWQQVLARDAKADGRFVYAVKSTGIFCRPSCPSRRPERKNVSFYPTPELARAAGFRACLRCEPEQAERREDPQVKAISRVTSYLAEHAGEPTRLKDVAKATGVAPLTILRGFKRVLGVTPREYAKAQRVERFRDRVREPGTRVTDAIYEAGYGSASRLYEDGTLGMTPGALKAGGAGETVRYTTAESALGRMLVAATARGVCAIAFGDDDAALEAELAGRFPKAVRQRMDAELSYAVDEMAQALEESAAAPKLPLDVRATAFQLRVWRELQKIPRGETRSYSEVAEAVGAPAAVRAVAAACAANPVAVAVPCHRVVGKDGRLTGYRWGVERKRALLEREGARG